MRILFDQGTPVPLRKLLSPHSIDTASELGWSQLSNGDLISAAEGEGYEALITTDKSLRYQQNLAHRKIGIIVLSTTSWPKIRSSPDKVLSAINSLQDSSFIEVVF
jgi:hypothetical protein